MSTGKEQVSTMYSDFEISEIVRTYNEWKRDDAAKAKVTPTLIGERFLAKLWKRGFTASQLAAHVRERCISSASYKSIYELLAVKALKSADVPPLGNPTEQEETTPTVETVPTEPTEQEQEAEQEQTTPTTPTEQEAPKTDALGGVIVNALRPAIESIISEIVPKMTTGGGKITVQTAEATHTIEGLQHEKFAALLNMVANDRTAKKSPYLVGPAGSGKNVLAEQVADALGLPFYYQNSVTDEYQLKGYMNAEGEYVPTPFYESMKNGGVFMLDEMDASDSTALITANAALAGYYMTFPNGEKVIASENWHVIGAGNTFGRGASSEYNGRNAQDGSTLNRFAALFVDYDTRIEDSLTDDAALIDFCRAFRRSAKAAELPAIVSYRDISALAAYTQFMPAAEAVESILLAGLSRDDFAMIESGLPADNIYTTAAKQAAVSLY